MRAIDTNVLVRLITRDDAVQAGAADEFVSGGAWVSHLVLAEAAWVLDAVYEVKAAQIGDAIEMLLNHQSLVIQDADVAGAALAQFRARPAVGFSDCLILEIARKAGHTPLATFDRDLSKIAGAVRLKA